MSLLQVKTSFNIDLNFETAPFHLRLIAWIIDFILLCFFLWFMGWLIGEQLKLSNISEYGLIEIFIVCPFLLYHLICELFLNGQSIGKTILGIKVVSLTGQNATASQYILRWIMRFVDFGILWCVLFLASKEYFIGTTLILGCTASFIMFVTSKNNQRMGDIVAGTTVVLKKLPYKISDTIFKEVSIENYKVTFPEVMKLSDKDINIINNVLKQHYKSSIFNHLATVSLKIKSVLHIDSEMENDQFLETLLRDYNYLSRK